MEFHEDGEHWYIKINKKYPKWIGYECKLKSKSYHDKNKKSRNARHKEYISEHPNYFKEYFEKNKEHLKEYRRARYKRLSVKDPNYKISRALRSRVRLAIKNNQKTGSAIKDLGCSVEEFKKYLENLWKPGMSWNTFGYRGWHIDHIRPLASFDLTDPEQFKQACHYTNLQPLWATDNFAKGDKYDK